MRILILDDNEGILDLLKCELEEVGAEVWAYSHPGDALTDLIHNKMDLIITDFEMPQMDGVSFSARARLLQKTPIFLYTASSEVIVSENIIMRFDKMDMNKMINFVKKYKNSPEWVVNS